ncbi:YxiG-like protein [Micromonospora taraxaci]|uniref:YxiG-like protein n=1 Tax=Micromonospora taraxaci TaxID=1316803 RepID=UPI0033A5DD71
MEVAQLRQALDEIFDSGIVHHGYTDYMRDYEVITYVTADPRTGIPPVYLRYLFTYCVVAEVQTAVSPDTWRCSLDERLTDRKVGPDLDGFVWAVRWQPLYPGAEVVADSERARWWADKVGIPFHEARFEMNAHAITLVFSDLDVAEVREGYAPFTVTEDD